MQESEVSRVRRTIGYAYQSYQRVKSQIEGRLDRDVRHPEWTGRLLDEFDRPDTKAFNVMVAGSKGKGSNAILTAALLQRAGVRTGLFTGPHHVDFMERFRIDGDAMPEDTFCRYMEEVYTASDALPVPAGQYIGPVGILTVVAARWFCDEGVEVGVYECGRGAKHDDVNQIRHQGAILTPVFLEHTAQLGATLSEIAAEKTAVVASETKWLVSVQQDGDVEAALQGASTGRMHPFVLTEVEWDVHAHGWVRAVFRHDDRNTEVCLLLPDTSVLLWQNAAAALTAAHAVWQDIRPGIPFPGELDLRNVRLPGRMDVLQTKPLVLLDGTIHRSGAAEIVRFAHRAKQDGRVDGFQIVVSLPSDKDVIGVLAALASLSDGVLLTTTTNPHLVYDRHSIEIAKEYFTHVDWVPDVEAAVHMAQRRAGLRDAVILVGTQSFVGDVLRLYGEVSCSIWREGFME